jgi:hypothetical protein
MNSFGMETISLSRLEWKKKNGKFTTWKVGNFYWHGPEKYNINGKKVSVFKETLSQMPKKKVWYLRGMRQHIWRRCKKIKGFVPFIRIDIMRYEGTFVLYQDGPVMPDLGFVIRSFLKSSAHRNLTNNVCN